MSTFKVAKTFINFSTKSTSSVRQICTSAKKYADVTLKPMPIVSDKKSITVNEKENVGLISGIPLEHRIERHVRIYIPAKNAMQSGTNGTKNWRIEFETQERWENPTMGWCSTADPLSNTHVQFSSKEEAAKHCEKHGWKYTIDERNWIKLKPKTYAENFSWNKRTRIGSK